MKGVIFLLESKIKSLKSKLETLILTVTNTLSKRRIKACEKTILLKMGLSPDQVKKIITYGCNYGLLEEGLGIIVWRTAKNERITPVEAGKRMSQGLHWNEIGKERKLAGKT